MDASAVRNSLISFYSYLTSEGRNSGKSNLTAPAGRLGAVSLPFVTPTTVRPVIPHLNPRKSYALRSI